MKSVFLKLFNVSLQTQKKRFFLNYIEKWKIVVIGYNYVVESRNMYLKILSNWMLYSLKLIVYYPKVNILKSNYYSKI